MTNDQMPTILAIDDDIVILTTFRQYLEDYDFNVITASDGPEGVELFKTHSPHVVLCDLDMPEMNGLSVMKELKKLSPDTPVIVVTGTGDIGDAVEALRLGAWDFLQKPLDDLTVLRHSVDKALAQRELVRQNRLYQEKLESLVSQRTGQLEKANAELQTINKRLRNILETTKHISHFSRFEQFGSWLLEEFSRHMLASGGSLYHLEKDGLRLVHALDPGHAPAFIPFPLPPNSMLNQVLVEGKPLLVRDISCLKEFINSGWKGYEGDSCLIFPLPDEGGKIQGFLSLHSKTPPPFVEQDRELGALLASCSSEAMRAARASEALRASEEYLSITIDSIGHGVIATDSDGAITRMNPEAETLTGWSLKEARGMTLNDVFHLVDADTRQQVTEDIFGDIVIAGASAHWPKNVLLIHRNGNEFRVAPNGTPILDKKGYSMGAVLVFRDITQHLNLEEQLRQARKMEAIGQLAGGVAHDFNNMLAGIVGAADIIARKLADNKNLKKYVSMIQDAGNRAAELTQKLLDFSRKDTIPKRTVNLHRLIVEAVRILERSIDKRMEIKKILDAQWPVVTGDAVQLENAVLNLGINARDAMPKGGTLTISTSDVTLDQKQVNLSAYQLPPGHYILLRVQDTGTGIEKADIDHIFEPFFTTKLPGKGTGLGLASVYNTVQLHGGEIRFETKIGAGTCFEIYLPAQRSAVVPMDEKEDDDVPNGSGCILVVDDEDIIRGMTESILRDLGYDVLLASNGKEAIDLYSRNQDCIRLVLLDIVMPEMNGRDAMEAIRKLNPEVKILLTSGFDHPVQPQAKENGDMEHFIKKPYRRGTLGRLVHRLIMEGVTDKDV